MSRLVELGTAGKERVCNVGESRRGHVSMSRLVEPGAAGKGRVRSGSNAAGPCGLEWTSTRNLTLWVWDYRSAARLSKLIRGACGPQPASQKGAVLIHIAPGLR
jgi:hypothetical protein